MYFRLYFVPQDSTHVRLTDVEHSTNAGAFSPPVRSLPQIQHEGFEPSGDQDELAVESGGTYGLVSDDALLRWCETSDPSS